MTGSATLVDWLLRQGLLDELHLLVFPVVLGSGKRLFGDGGEKLPLELIGSATFEIGVVRLTYARNRDMTQWRGRPPGLLGREPWPDEAECPG